MAKDGRLLEDYIATMSNTVVLGKQWHAQDTPTPENLMTPSGLLMYTDRGEVAIWYCMAWYGMVNVDLYSAIITKVSNALNTLVSGEKPGFRPCLKDS